MTIDNDILSYYDWIAQRHPAPAQPDDMQAQRAHFAQVAREALRPLPPGVTETDLSIALPGRTLRARLYRPSGRQPALLVYFHGGGWATGDIDTHGTLCALLAADAGMAVISVDYRLAPEYPFPAPIEDARDALLWCAEQRIRLGLSARRLAVGGDSAGAYLAAQAASLSASRVPGLVDVQWLVYPAIRPYFDTPSYAAYADSIGLTRDEMDFYWSKFLGQAEGPAPCAGDIHADLMAAPPPRVPPRTVMVVAQYDPLHDEGVDYARFVERHGGTARLIEAAGMTHSFARLQPFVPAGRRIMREAAAALREWMG